MELMPLPIPSPIPATSVSYTRNGRARPCLPRRSRRCPPGEAPCYWRRPCPGRRTAGAAASSSAPRAPPSGGAAPQPQTDPRQRVGLGLTHRAEAAPKRKGEQHGRIRGRGGGARAAGDRADLRLRLRLRRRRVGEWGIRRGFGWLARLAASSARSVGAGEGRIQVDAWIRSHHLSAAAALILFNGRAKWGLPVHSKCQIWHDFFK